MLFSPSHHEPLTDRGWDETWVRGRIEQIAAEAEAAVRPDGTWPEHPADHEDGMEMPRTVYMGAAGVAWGLHVLGHPCAHLVTGLDDAYRARPDWPGAAASYWAGEAGVLLMMHVAGGRDDVLDRLHACIVENAGDPSNELLHGAPGTMIVAAELHRRTGEERWADAWRLAADQLWRRWARHEECGCDLWTQVLSGREAVYIGAGHGFAGCVTALLRGAGLLDGDRAAELDRRAVATARATAVREAGRANWPPLPGSLERNDRIRLQWCHGAPGMVASLAGLAPGDERFGGLLAEGAELVWDAGPVAGGAGLCHGTAGNGLAFLAMYGRSGDERWLERARGFAVHALEQAERERDRHGVGRFSLWTGDIGVAVMARQCIDARAGVPTLDWV
ncbi:MAG TPA: LanC-like protein [Gaiellales bacterium]|jgi:hypothetical protein